MATSDLQTALENLDAEIAAMKFSAASASHGDRAVSYRKLSELLASRKALISEIASEDGSFRPRVYAKNAGRG